jgi:hypothetical protein
MAASNEAARRYPSSFRLTSGLEVLDEWSLTASQAEKNAVNRALFAVVEKTVFTEYVVVDDGEKTMEFFVFVRNDFVLKVRVHELGSFGIVYVGPATEAPGLDRLKADLEVFTGESALDRRSRQKKP